MYRLKNTPRLLRQVKNKEYATNEHHEDPLSKQQRADAANIQEAELDLEREPDSDSDLERDNGDSKIDSKDLGHSQVMQSTHATATSVRPNPDVDLSFDDGDKEKLPGWERPYSRTRIGAAGKRVVSKVVDSRTKTGLGQDCQGKTKPAHTDPMGGDDIATRAESAIFSGSSQGSKKRVRAGYGKASVVKKPRLESNVRDAGKDKTSFRPPRGQTTGSRNSSPQAEKVCFVKPKVIGGETRLDSSLPGSSPPAGPSFRKPTGMVEAAVPASTETSGISKDAEFPPSSRSRSSSLSSLSPSEGFGPVELDSLQPSSYDSTSACPLCAEQVDNTFKMDFMVENGQSGRMNFRLQQLFCKTHNRRTAEKIWSDRKYPDIDWAKLRIRLRKHDQRIRGVLNGTIRSHFRHEHGERLRSGMTKTTLQTWRNGVESRTKMGYYGSRGEEVMTDYIVNTFSKELRRRAGTDKAISAMGVSGGVTGYVQSVLVPEMALALVMEDACCTEDEGRNILAESSGIGEILNAAEEERVSRGTACPDAYESGSEDETGVTLLD